MGIECTEPCIFTHVLLQNQIQPSKSEDLVALLSDLWIGQHPIQQLERHSKELYKMEGFSF